METKRLRSPNYPAITIQDAIERLGRIYPSQRRYPTDRETLAKLLGYSGISGASSTIISAISKYGLLEGHGDNLRVSELGQELAVHDISDTEFIAAAEIAVRQPAFFQEMDSLYPDGLPSDQSLRSLLLKRGFNEKALELAIKVYRESIEFVDQISPATHTTVESTERVDAQDSERYKRPGGMGGKSVQVPLVDGKWATVSADFPLSEAAWKQLMDVLNVLKPGLTAESTAKAVGGSKQPEAKVVDES